MIFPTSILKRNDITQIESTLINPDGLIKAVPYEDVKNFSQNDISLFCLKHAVYQIITTELVDFVEEQIANFSKTIEIGSGNGCLGRALGIPMTDNRMQERPEIIDFYRSTGQPVIKYGADVRKLDALDAVKILKADCAVASWVTHKKKPHTVDGNMYGVDNAILSKRVKRLVFVGNEITHRHMEMHRFVKPRIYKFDWLLSRSLNKSANVIWIFDF